MVAFVFARNSVRYLLLLFIAFGLTPISAAAEFDVPATAASSTSSSEILHPDDPWENFNRKMFSFNEGMDQYLLKPTAVGYTKAVPQAARTPIGSFFKNLRDFRSGINNILQWRWREAGHNLGRFTLNSTLGVLGFFDVATSTGLKRETTDLGITLARWGVPEGPYLMLPLLGPSTVRDATTIYPSSLMGLNRIDHSMTKLAVVGLQIVDARAQLLEYESAIIGDRYNFIREFYLQDRRDKAGIDRRDDDFKFGDSDDWDDEDW